MTHETEYTTSSPVSTSGVVSISDVDSNISIGDKPVPDALSNPKEALFDMDDGDLRLMVNGVGLETHKYLIKKFAGLKSRIQNSSITLESNEHGAEDFQNTFKVLYASVVEGPFHFDPGTLTSALRIATAYDYPTLRAFAIKNLENASLSAIERIRLAREFGLSSWEKPAYVELCNRNEALTQEEAGVLGLDAFVHVARIREQEQLRKRRDVDAAARLGHECQAGEEPTINTIQASKKTSEATRSSQVVSDAVSNRIEQDSANEASMEMDKNGEVGTIPHPSFIDVPTKGTRWRQAEYYTFVLDAPGCQCTNTDPGGPCALPPCVASAIKYLQTQQLVHNAGISKLETTMKQVQNILVSLTNPRPQAGLDSDEPVQTERVDGEVRKWLTDAEFHAPIA